MTENFRPTVLRNKAWQALEGKWNMAAIVGLVALLIMFAAGGVGTVFKPLNIFISIGFSSFISVGLYFHFLDVYRGETPEVSGLFEAFSDYFRYLIGILLVFVYVLLWMLLLIIPGIIKSFSYAMTYYIMRENPEMKGEEAIQTSMKMMEGHKMDFFLLGLSFLGWALLAILTLGIGFIWLLPYIYTTYGAFYEEVKKDYAAKEAVVSIEAEPAV